jgi:hypothetical protein
MSNLFDANNRPLVSKRHVPLFVVSVNLENGNTEIVTSRDNIMKLPLPVRQAIVDGIRRVAEADFNCKMSINV